MVSHMKRTKQNWMVEWTFKSRKDYTDPFNDIEVSAVFTDPNGNEGAVPAFWAGENIWCVRYASNVLGKHNFRIESSDESNDDLNNQEGLLEVLTYDGRNPLYRHGPLRISQDRRYIEHVDRTPFFWLGDTWWMGLTKRLRWPEEFKLLTADRIKKGFTVIQIVAGLYPDMPPFDPRGANEAGFPWNEDFTRINPSYFDMMDRRIDWLVHKGLVPCIVGSWGYFIMLAGEETMKKHWRYIVARYGAYPVIWCLAGEAAMPYYTLWCGQRHKEQIPNARTGWTNIARYLRSIDPFHHLITVHPTSPNCAHNMVDDPSAIDIDMLQTGHSGMMSLPDTVNTVSESVARHPPMPVVVGEVCYEGIMGGSWEDIQRLMFWTSLLNGTAGHTYGANGIWQINTKTKPFGPSPHGQSWGDMPWQEACQLPGSKQLGLGKNLLERYPWWRFKSHSEWAEPHWSRENYLTPYAAGIPGEVRIVYMPAPAFGLAKIKNIEPGVPYHAFYFNPRNGREHDIGKVALNEKGEWQPPKAPIIQDWVLVITAK